MDRAVGGQWLMLGRWGGATACCSGAPARAPRMGRALILMLMLALGRPVAAAIDFDWQSVDAVLGRHVVDARVDYPGLRSDPAFAGLVAAVAGTDLAGATRDERLAFYINAYNLLAIQGILNGRSPATGPGKWRYFYLDRYAVAGERISLNTLEQKRLRTLGEPRIHFAIVCASRSCPLLGSRAWQPSRLDAQLDAAARRFVNDPQRNRFDLAAGEARLSKIFQWFDEDFLAAGGVSAWLADYVADPALADALRREALTVKYLPYDWSLNGTPP